MKTKRINGTDLSERSFLYVGDPKRTETWLLPVYDQTSEHKTKQNIQRSLQVWDCITNRLPSSQLLALHEQLLGAAQSHGLSTPDPAVLTEVEMHQLLAEIAEAKTLSIAEIDVLYG